MPRWKSHREGRKDGIQCYREGRGDGLESCEVGSLSKKEQPLLVKRHPFSCSMSILPDTISNDKLLFVGIDIRRQLVDNFRRKIILISYVAVFL